jgi:hypothetical protein
MFQDCRLRELARQDICELARLWRGPIGKKTKEKRIPGPLEGKKKEIFWGKMFTENPCFFHVFVRMPCCPVDLCENI